MKRPTLTLLSLACLLSAAVTCESDIIDDPSFQLWCGQRLCVWDTEEGEIRKVPTWHTNDYGVDLVGSPVLLSQEARNSASSVRIEVTSQIQQGTIVSVEIDHEGDGRIDWKVTVPPSEDFTNHEWRVDEGVSSDGIFYLRKSGEGRAVVARLRASRF